jgi:hypothetical protein
LVAFNSVLGDERELDWSSSLESSTIPSITSVSFPLRRAIPIEHDFELFQLVLRYLYTNTICFTTTSGVEADSDVSTTTDAEGIYAIANNFRIKPLELKALSFLGATCNLNNITARTFSKFAATNPAVGELYDSYFIGYWRELKQNKPMVEEVFTSVRDPEESNRINTKFRAMMWDLP